MPFAKHDDMIQAAEYAEKVDTGFLGDIDEADEEGSLFLLAGSGFLRLSGEMKTPQRRFPPLLPEFSEE